ncbi:MAG: hypothetical protein ACI9HK_003185 [Pirellulaceae bacterium]
MQRGSPKTATFTEKAESVDNGARLALLECWNSLRLFRVTLPVPDVNALRGQLTFEGKRMNEIEFFDIIWVIAGGAFINKMNWRARVLVLVASALLIAGFSYTGYSEYHRYQVYYKLGMASRYRQRVIKLPIIATDVQNNESLRKRMISEVRGHLAEQNRGDATFDVTAIQYQGESWYHFNKIIIEYRFRDTGTLAHVTIDITPDPQETLRFCEGLVVNRLQSQSGLLDVSASN